MDKHQRFLRDVNEATARRARDEVRGLTRAEVLRGMYEPAGLLDELPAAFGAQGALGGTIAPLMPGGPPPLAWEPDDLTGADRLDRIVDIYISAGPHGDPLAANGSPSCDPNDATTCALWRIQMRLVSKEVVSVEQLQGTGADSLEDAGLCPGGHSNLQPAASPDGTRYAWQRTCLGPWPLPPLSSTILETAAPPTYGPGGPATTVTTSAKLLMYPNWYNSAVITWSVGSGANHPHTLFWGYAWGKSWGSTSGGIGADGTSHLDMSYSDPHSHSAPTYLGATGAPRVATFGGLVADNQRTPRVTSLGGGDEEPFDVPADWGGPGQDVPECHHPAWNPRGDRILCTRYQHAEDDLEGFTDDGAATEYGLRRLYLFESNGEGHWIPSDDVLPGEAGALVQRLTDKEFNSIPGKGTNLFPPRYDTSTHSGGCRTYVWKFAEWCQSDRFLVATVFCSSGMDWDTSMTALHSRVVLIDTRDTSTAAAGYTDLTSIIEDTLPWAGVGSVRGTYSAYFGSCGKSSANGMFA